MSVPSRPVSAVSDVMIRASRRLRVMRVGPTVSRTRRHLWESDSLTIMRHTFGCLSRGALTPVFKSPTVASKVRVFCSVMQFTFTCLRRMSSVRPSISLTVGVNGGADAAARSKVVDAAGTTTGWQAVEARADNVDSASVRSADVGRMGVNTHHAMHSVTANLNALRWRETDMRARAWSATHVRLSEAARGISRGANCLVRATLGRTEGMARRKRPKPANLSASIRRNAAQTASAMVRLTSQAVATAVLKAAAKQQELLRSTVYVANAAAD
eukprot:6184993-Pleurochrysis_carterae.AAC.3